MITAIVFYVFALSAVVLALGVITARNPIYSALCLIGCLFAVAGIYVLLHAQLMALLQVLVYAGAIMVLILFVIMLLNLSDRELGKGKVNIRKILGTYFVGATATLLVARQVEHVWRPEPEVPATFGSIEGVGKVLYTEYLLPFEMVSILLLGAIIGAVVLTRKGRGSPS